MGLTIIAKNQTGSPITLRQLAVTIPASPGQVTLSDFNADHEIRDDFQLEAEIAAGNIILNDGTTDLNQTESLNFLTTVTSTGDSDVLNDLLEVKDEGISLGKQKRRLNFVGTGITASVDGGDPDQVNVSIPSASGEANTASNQGAGGVGLFDTKNGVDLEFRNINAGSNKVTVALDAPNREVDIDVAEGNLDLANISGTLAGDSAHGNRGGGTLHSAATIGTAGFMSASDKTKLDGIEDGAELNTASNVGVGGVGPYKQKTGSDLEFRNINAGSPKITVALDAVNDEIDIDVSENNLSLANISGTLGSDGAHGIRGGGNLHAAATTGTAGFMSATDKQALDDLGTRYTFYPAWGTISNIGAFAVVSVGANSQTFMTFHIPGDFVSLVTANIVAIPVATFTNQNIDLFTDYGAAGEAYNTHSESDITSVYSGTANVLLRLNLNAILTQISAGDFVGVEVDHNAIGTTIGYLGVELEYTR